MMSGTQAMKKRIERIEWSMRPAPETSGARRLDRLSDDDLTILETVVRERERR